MSQGNDDLLVGIDLGRWLHVVSVLDAQGELLAERGFPHSSEGLSEIVDWLLQMTGNDPKRIAVAIEKPHGAVVETLLERGIAVFSINPKQLDRLRDRHGVSGAKDDRRDAFVLADSLRNDRHFFQRLSLPPPEIIALRELLRSHEQLLKQHVALSSQITDLLIRCWPHLLSLAPKNRPLDPFFCELMQLFFDARKPSSLDAQGLQALIKKHHIRRVSLNNLLETLHKPPLRVAEGTQAATAAHTRLLLQQLLLVRAQRRDCDQHLQRWLQQLQRSTRGAPLQDAAILASLPGVGAFVLANLLTHAREAIRLRNLQAFRNLAGIAPVTQQSGKRRYVSMRRACSQPLKHALHHWASIAVRRDTKFKQHYDQLRQRGHRHARALRGVMDRILAITVAMLRDRTLYDSNRSTGSDNDRS